jgi:acyl-CoA thioester hydrolase
MLTHPPREHFEIPITVLLTDIDELDHVNNVVYLRWIMEVAVAHWTTAATPEQQAEIGWIALRHEIDYKRPTLLGDAVIARTWVGVASSHRFERHTEIIRATDSKVLAKSISIYCPINRVTGKLTRVSDDIRAHFAASDDVTP